MQSLALLRAGHNPCQRREMTISTNNGLVNGLVHNLPMQLFTLGRSQIECFEACFYDIVTKQYDHPRYVKHVFRPYLHVSHPIWVLGPGWGWGAPKGLVHNMLMQLFTLDSSKIEVFETCFYAIVFT